MQLNKILTALIYNTTLKFSSFIIEIWLELLSLSLYILKNNIVFNDFGIIKIIKINISDGSDNNNKTEPD